MVRRISSILDGSTLPVRGGGWGTTVPITEMSGLVTIAAEAAAGVAADAADSCS